MQELSSKAHALHEFLIFVILDITEHKQTKKPRNMPKWDKTIF